MTQGRSRGVPIRVGRSDLDQLSRLRRVRAAAARAGLRGARDAEHPRSVRAEARHEPRGARAVGSAVLAPDGRSEEARLLRSAGAERRSEIREGAGEQSAVEVLRGHAVRPDQPGQGVKAGGRRRHRRRHHLSRRPPIAGATWCRSIHSVFSVYGSRATVPPYGFVLHNRGSAFSLDPTKPEHRRAAQAAVPHDHRRLRDEGRPAAHDVREHGRQRAARDARAAHGEPDRSRHERADDDRRRALHAQPDVAMCCRSRRICSTSSARR